MLISKTIYINPLTLQQASVYTNLDILREQEFYTTELKVTGLKPYHFRRLENNFKDSLSASYEAQQHLQLHGFIPLSETLWLIALAVTVTTTLSIFLQ